MSSNGIFVGSVTAIQDANGTVDLFVVGSDGDIYHNSGLANESWYTEGHWPAMGGNGIFVGSVTAVQHTNGTVDLFAVGSDGNVYHNEGWADENWYTTGNWPGMSTNGIFIDAVTGIQYANGTFDLFAVGSDGNVYHNEGWTDENWYTEANWPAMSSNGIFVGTSPGGNLDPRLRPGAPVKEYVYANGQVIAIENAGP